MKKAICVLSAGIKKNKAGYWVSTNLTKEDDKLGAPGGKLRVIAASYLYKDCPDILIIVSGGRGWDVKNDELERPDLSEIIKLELIELGVSEQNIIKENKSNKTFEQLKELKKIVDNEKFDETTIITNDYHLARVKTMLEYVQELSKMFADKRIALQSAEKICLQHDRGKWCNIIKEAYESKEMKHRMAMETDGIRQIKNGTYKF